MNKKWTTRHKIIIKDFLAYLNSKSNKYILKGGTALMMCYSLDRFSEDIDLDSIDKNSIKKIVDYYSHERNLNYRISKDTDTTKRFFIHYGNIKPLKIEVSHRRKQINPSSHDIIDNIVVYNIDELALMKAFAYSGRDRIRDLYDLSFICNNYWEDLCLSTKNAIRNSIEYKGIEQFDYLINTQSDELIDNDKLVTDFLEMFDKLDLLYERKDIDYKKHSLGEIKSKKNKDTWER